MLRHHLKPIEEKDLVLLSKSEVVSFLFSRRLAGKQIKPRFLNKLFSGHQSYFQFFKTLQQSDSVLLLYS